MTKVADYEREKKYDSENNVFNGGWDYFWIHIPGKGAIYKDYR
jgi:hypothetical protein